MSFKSCDYNVLEDDYSLGWLKNQPITKDNQVQELKSRFSLRRRINLYFVDFIELEDCGTSTFEGIFTLLDANAFIEKDCFDKPAEQISHHLGHILGLRNTYHQNEIDFINQT